MYIKVTIISSINCFTKELIHNHNSHWSNQEALYNQIQDLERSFRSNWGWIGVGRDDGKKQGEFVPIFYNK